MRRVMARHVNTAPTIARLTTPQTIRRKALSHRRPAMFDAAFSSVTVPLTNEREQLAVVVRRELLRTL